MYHIHRWKPFLRWPIILLLLLLSDSVIADWALFKQRFFLPEGRVIDTGQNNMSHSEGQSAVMLLAVHYDDREVFDSIWQWTKQNLQVREDKLLAWHWSSDCGLIDLNNATDGDLFFAWALLRANNQWGNPGYLADALEIIEAIRQNLLFESQRGIVLLPGIHGFKKSQGTVINLSYWVFPALQEIAKVDPAPQWQHLQQTGTQLIKEANFGRWGLPADWLLLNGQMVLPKDFLPRFGYDAIRIPLYLLWGKNETAELLLPFKQFWNYFSGANFIPAWTNLVDDSIDSYNASPGIRSIVEVILHYPQLQSVSLPVLDVNQDYYSSLLLLLTKLMIQERIR